MSIGASSGNPGALISQGTATDPIVFTSSQADPSPGDWYYISFYNTTDDDSTVMDYCEVQYAGYASMGQVYIYNAAPALSNCTFTNSSSYDLYYSGTVGGTISNSTFNSGIYLVATSTVDFTGNAYNFNSSYAIKAYADYVGDIVYGNTFTNVDSDSYLEVLGDTIERDATWTSAIPYAITGNITVQGTDGDDSITTLTIDPGATLKFNSSRSMNIGTSSGNPGALISQGTAIAPIVFTSSQASPAAGDWSSIRFYNTTDDATTLMKHCVVEYGGSSSGALYLYNAAPTIQNSTIRNSSTAGIYATGSDTATAAINCNTFTANQNGIYWTVSPAPEMHSNNFSGNTSYGIYYTGSATMDAENNWWNDITGPNQSGDSTYGNVDADPWSTEENDCTGTVENQPPNEPSDPTPNDAAVRVSTNGGVTLSWTGGDPNILDSVTYDLYWGTSSGNLQPAATDLSQTTYTQESVSQGLTYYWQIIARDNNDAETTGPVWHFTTDGDSPDLIISQVTSDPTGNLQSGQSVTFTATIQNVGSGPVVDGSFNIGFNINGASVCEMPVDGIMLANESVDVSCIWTFDGGDTSIQIIADSQYSISETYEDNNQFIALLSEIVDNEAPTLTHHSPADSENLQQISQIVATLVDNQNTVDDAAVMASFSLVDQMQQQVSGTLNEVDDTFTFTPESLPLLDSTYTVSMTAIDTLGNQQIYQFSFVIDTQPPAKPTVTGGSVASGTIQPRPTINQADDFMVPLEGTRDTGASLWINGTQYLPSEADSWSVEMTLQQGDNALEIWCVDQAGNQSESEWVDIFVEPSNGLIFDYNDAGRVKRARRIQ